MKQNDKSQSTTYCDQDQIKTQYIDTTAITNKFGTKKYRQLNRYFHKNLLL